MWNDSQKIPWVKLLELLSIVTSKSIPIAPEWEASSGRLRSLVDLPPVAPSLLIAESELNKTDWEEVFHPRKSWPRSESQWTMAHPGYLHRQRFDRDFVVCAKRRDSAVPDKRKTIHY